MSADNDGQCSLSTEQRPSSQPRWYVYLIRAANQALYCGISTNPKRRFEQHQRGKGARFFHSSAAQTLVYVEVCADRTAALRREHQIKQLSKCSKEALLWDAANTLSNEWLLNKKI